MRQRSSRPMTMAAIAVGLCLGLTTPGHAQFTSLSDRSKSMLEGNWQSCRDASGQYSERVYDGKWTGLAPFELHMGPLHEFALFRGIQDEHRDHNSSENLLQPHAIEPHGGSARHSWDVAGLHLDVTLAGGSLDTCESWYVTLRRSTMTSSSH